MRKIILFLSVLLSFAVQAQNTTNFSKAALEDELQALNGTTITVAEILKQYQGKKVVIDVWASWCGDCVGGMPKVKEIQATYPEAVYLFLSVDKTFESWKKGIEKYKVVGEHYFMPNGWKSDFNNSIKLDWIPRYIVLNEKGEIVLYKATKATDERIVKKL